MLTTSVLASAAAIFVPAVSAAPATTSAGCELYKGALQLPEEVLANGLDDPSDETPTYVVLGRGIQNHTCTDGEWNTTMSVATLFDASCEIGKEGWENLTTLALEEPVPEINNDKPQTLLGMTKIGEHDWQELEPNATRAYPLFDFRPYGVADDMVIVDMAAKSADPEEPDTNVPWYELAAVEGEEGTLAEKMYRTHNVDGEAPDSCEGYAEGDKVVMEYAAFYWFFQ